MDRVDREAERERELEALREVAYGGGEAKSQKSKAKSQNVGERVRAAWRAVVRWLDSAGPMQPPGPSAWV